MGIRNEVKRWLAALKSAGSRERAEQEKRYLKSSLTFYGVSLPQLRASTKTWLKEHPDLDRRTLVALCRAFWGEPVHEARAVVVLLLQAREHLLEAEDLALLETLLRSSGSWAYVDAIAVHVVGPLVERKPRLARTLDRWARDDDFWIRRSAMLALLLPMRRGEGDWRRFSRYAASMLDEKEFFIRKAIGWVLREYGKKRPDRVAAFVARHRGRMAGLTLREAVRGMEMHRGPRAPS